MANHLAITPTVRNVVQEMRVQNKTAAVDIRERLFFAVAGLLMLAFVIVFADGVDKLLGLGFLGFPILPALIGVGIDYADAKRTVRKK